MAVRRGRIRPHQLGHRAAHLTQVVPAIELVQLVIHVGERPLIHRRNEQTCNDDHAAGGNRIRGRIVVRHGHPVGVITVDTDAEPPVQPPQEGLAGD